jgi:hypothetical protein
MTSLKPSSKRRRKGKYAQPVDADKHPPPLKTPKFDMRVRKPKKPKGRKHK